MLPTKTAQVIWEKDFSDLVVETYGRLYQLQQQEPMMAQNSYLPISVPDAWTSARDEDHVRVREWEAERREAEGKLGIRHASEYSQHPQWPTFQEWLDADPTASVPWKYESYSDGRKEQERPDWCRPGGLYHGLWWTRVFFPPLGEVIADLHKRGLLDEGDFLIHAWW